MGVCLLLLSGLAFARTMPLHPRATDAPGGAALVARLGTLDLTNREAQIFAEVVAGNVPEFYRQVCAVNVTNVTETRTNQATFFVAPDYLALGSDADYFLIPLTPVTAQRIADQLGCILPTRKMVNAIYTAAPVQLAPAPMTPGAKMITVPMFAEHNTLVRAQRQGELAAHPLGALVAGHKKDVVLTARLTNSPNKVAIYGWHQTNGTPIQPLYLGHTANWADYSHGVRLVQQTMLVNGATTTVAQVLADPALCGLLSDEGVVPVTRYATNEIPALPVAMREAIQPPKTNGRPPALGDFRPTGKFDEMTLGFELEPEVKVQVNAPLARQFATNKPVLLIFYALPNGNTIEQTIGRKRDDDDWHFNIQHIGAQTRYLRAQLPDRTVVVAYLEAGTKSWPAWRQKYPDSKIIPPLLAKVKDLFAAYPLETVLASHSGGGSLIFGYLNAVESLPADVVRLAFLDSNYAYRTTNHLAKLTTWLQQGTNHHLAVLAYHDDIALLNGKTFVSAEGGTWGRSRMMVRDLGEIFPLTRHQKGDLETVSALNGRLQFLLLENPERKIFHTVQVERNGLIQALLSGTAAEGKGYEYMGERAYEQWIEGQ